MLENQQLCALRGGDSYQKVCVCVCVCVCGGGGGGGGGLIGQWYVAEGSVPLETSTLKKRGDIAIS